MNLFDSSPSSPNVPHVSLLDRFYTDDYSAWPTEPVQDAVYSLTKELDYWWMAKRLDLLASDGLDIDHVWAARNYLPHARQELSRRGITPPPSLRETAIDNFNMKLPFIDTVTLYIGGFFGPSDIVTLTVSGGQVSRDREDLTDGRHTLPLDFPEPPAPTLDEIIEALTQAELGAWSPRYVNPMVMDGESWSLTITFQDEAGGKTATFRSSGSNDWPEGFHHVPTLAGLSTNASPADDECEEAWDEEDWDDEDDANDKDD